MNMHKCSSWLSSHCHIATLIKHITIMLILLAELTNLNNSNTKRQLPEAWRQIQQSWQTAPAL